MLKLRSATLVALASLALLAACKKTNDVDLKNENACVLGDGKKPDEWAKLAQCDDSCVDLNSDAKNCGACGNACAEGADCTEGFCVCPLPQSVCDNKCVDWNADVNNCDGCGIKCASGANCIDRTCACPEDGTVCSDKCVHLESDPENCGECGKACGEGDACVAGKCECAGQFCDGACTDTMSDDGNCGTCGNACDVGKTCQDGSCQCPNGGMVCDGVCMDTQNDPQHCGSCDKVCDNGCSQGLCVDVQKMWAAAHYTCAALDDDSVQCWGLLSSDWDSVDATHHAELDGAQWIGGGNTHSCVQFSSNVACWGSNDNGELGSDATEYQAFPMPVTSLTESDGVTLLGMASGDGFTCAVTNDGVNSTGPVLCWGRNDVGQTGQSSAIAAVPSPTAVPGLTTYGQIAAGRAHACAVADGVGLVCWGANDQNQLGHGPGPSNSTPELVGNQSGTVFELVAGGDFACTLSTSGEVRCWGAAPVSGFSGAKVVSGFDGTVAHIAAGSAHVCAITTPGSVYCWGEADRGRIGGAVTTSTPVQMTLPNGIVPVGLTAGDAHTCVWAQDGSAYCWGFDDFGQLGDGKFGSTKFSSAPVRVLF